MPAGSWFGLVVCGPEMSPLNQPSNQYSLLHDKALTCNPDAGLSQPAVEKSAAATAPGADTSADVEAYPGASLADKLTAATAQNK